MVAAWVPPPPCPHPQRKPCHHCHGRSHNRHLWLLEILVVIVAVVAVVAEVSSSSRHRRSSSSSSSIVIVIVIVIVVVVVVVAAVVVAVGVAVGTPHSNYTSLKIVPDHKCSTLRYKDWSEDKEGEEVGERGG